MTGTIYITGHTKLKYVQVEKNIICGSNDPVFEKRYTGIKILRARVGESVIITPRKEKALFKESSLRGKIWRIEGIK